MISISKLFTFFVDMKGCRRARDAMCEACSHTQMETGWLLVSSTFFFLFLFLAEIINRLNCRYMGDYLDNEMDGYGVYAWQSGTYV